VTPAPDDVTGPGGAAVPWRERPAPRGAPPPTPSPGRDAEVEQALARRCAAVAARADDPRTDRARTAATARLASLATPPGALGHLGDLAVHLAALAGASPPPVPSRPVLVVAAGDHGVRRRGVSPWPAAVSTRLASAICDGDAAVAPLADEIGARVVVLDVGLETPPPPHPRLVSARVVAGTEDLAVEDAMTRTQAATAVEVGARLADAVLAEGADLVALGDVGIANTTPSAALIAALTGAPAAEVTGRGTGIDDDTLARKRRVVGDAAARVAGRDDPLQVLAGVGGAEHAALVGVMLATAAARVPVVLDGVITDAAALVAAALAPAVTDAFVAGHRSAEPGAAVALHHLGVPPLVDLGMRLGEGSGAVLAVPTIRAAARLLRDVATLDELLATGQ
jgi:nicotinate-nucleotide--dimethylbenzimidazole phosphoribosyltransferase